MKAGAGPTFYALMPLHVACFALFYLALAGPGLPPVRGAAALLWWAKIGLELLASFYFFSAVLKSIDYLVSPATGAGAPPVTGDRAAGDGGRACPPVACVYLCAGDLDRAALASLCRVEYPGRYHVFVHDDSGDPRAAESVDAAAHELAVSSGRPVFVLRRPHRTGGKPGAVNYVLDRIGSRYSFVLLADNDSTAVDPRFLLRSLPLADDPRVAAVQFRNVGVPAAGEARVNVLLRRAIEVFDLFARHQARHGMSLFVGHNALLRTAALRDAGGLREGVFADDIDLSIRLVRRGWRIVYAPGIPFGESHPVSYAAFRRRAYKWAFGCGQILREHLLPVLRDRSLRFAQKAGLLEFVGFYSIQAVLIAYLVLVGLVLPLAPGAPPGEALPLVLSGAAILVSIFLPSFAWHARHRRLGEWWPFALVCAVVYGSVAFASARGLVDGLRGRHRTWTPTNLAVRGRGLVPAVALESVFGLLLFAVPALQAPAVLWQPSMYLFATVFLCAPAVALLYAPRGDRPAGAAGGGAAGRGRRRPPRLLRAGVILAAVLAVAAPLLIGGGPPPRGGGRRAAAVDGERIVVGGRPFLVKGVHYSPWLPGTGPMKDHPWPEETVDRDLGLIAALGANTILVHDAPVSIFAAARARGLQVIYTYFINWQSIGDDAAFRARAAAIGRSAAIIGSEPNLLLILAGNEVVEWVLEKHGAPYVEARLRDLAARVRAAAPGVPLGHANWPIAKRLDLSFLDVACFNLYPSWPREVVVAGYGGYIESVLKPIAAGRPLLITEFGQNTLEASEEKQAEVLRRSWDEIRARTAGGVVFSFADEWWKNYDNPVAEGDWWEREYAPDDERTRDLDPEEYYGIVTSERAPKPGYAAVRDMFAERRPAVGGAAPYAVPLVLLLGYTIWLLARGKVGDADAA